jgi:Uma2 family endonuclease
MNTARQEHEPRISQAHYLAVERIAPFKSEFWDGQIIAMAGGTKAHAMISTNLLAALHARLKKRGCQIFNSDLKVKVEASNTILYPDASVSCEEPKLLDGHHDVLLNPILLAEVLSPSTEARDGGIKFFHYSLIPSLRHYLLFSQHEPFLRCFTRETETDLFHELEVSGLNGELRIPFIGLSLREIYDGL